MEGRKKPMVVLTGPTAVGKTALSIRLAKAIGGEIVSADSMQVYRGMDIGSAKITEEEMEGVPHHLIDVLDPWEEFHVARFQEMGKAACEEIWERGHIPIITGGTGFYIQALLYDVSFTAESRDSLRKEWEEQAKTEEGRRALFARLKEIDPASAEIIHPNNSKRVIRALEFYQQTGRRISEHNEEERQKESPYAFLYGVLTRERQILYERIDRRVDLMVEKGLIEEVKRLREEGCHRRMVAMQGLGYKEILDYLEGVITLEEALYRIKRDTRHFAKRQMTWFRREKEVSFFEMDGKSEEEVLAEILETLRERNILRDDSEK